MEADSLKHKYRRLQFRLRTLMIGVTLFAIPLGYIGWQAKIVRDRKVATIELITGGGTAIGAEGLSPSALAHGRDYTIPYLRRWMGDHAVFWIMCKYGTDDEVRRLRSLFPEALIDPESVFEDSPNGSPATQH
jgi:hypothetical protein